MNLKEQVISLAPWALEVEVANGLSTKVAEEAQRRMPLPDTGRPMQIVPVGIEWKRLLEALYPQGLDQRSILDCGCNCGAYIYWAKERGAGKCLGIDLREHWLRQARFLGQFWPSDGVRFENLDIYDLPKRGGEFDIAFFLGIFYHLPDPIRALQVVAERTREVIILDTATKIDVPDDGGLFAVTEGTESALCGVYGLSWRPSGPKALAHIFRWLGFPEMRVVENREFTRRGEGPGRGRLRVVAARDRATLTAYDRSAPAP